MTDCRAVGVGCRPRAGLGQVCLLVDDNGVCTSWAPAAPAAATTPGFNWDSWVANLIGGAAKTTENILTAQNQTKGVYTQTGPGGTVTYVQPAGNQGNIFSSTGITGTATGSSGMGMILIAGAGLFLVFMLAKGKG